MIDWVPVAFLTFKVLIFGACMFFAIFMLALLCVLAFTFGLSWKLGMDLRLP